MAEKARHARLIVDSQIQAVGGNGEDMSQRV
jgi:hypothetical protein